MKWAALATPKVSPASFFIVVPLCDLISSSITCSKAFVAVVSPSITDVFCKMSANVVVAANKGGTCRLLVVVPGDGRFTVSTSLELFIFCKMVGDIVIAADEGCSCRNLLIVTDDGRPSTDTPESVVCCSKFGRLERVGTFTMVPEGSAMLIEFDMMVVDGVHKVAR